jgi:biopolymer transport protein ExbD
MKIKNYILLFLIYFAFSCGNKTEYKPELLLKADGSIYENSKYVSINDIERYSDCDEVIIVVEQDVPYEKVVDLMTKLKSVGIDNVGMKANINL